MADEPDQIWFRLRGYVDGASTLELALEQLLDACAELEQLALDGYVLDRPAEQDGLALSLPPPVRAQSANLAGNGSVAGTAKQRIPANSTNGHRPPLL